MKKILTLILFCIIAFNAIHAEITWTLSNDGTLTISGTGDMGYYEDNPAPWRDQGIIKKVIIKNGVTSIGGYAFVGIGLTSVTIPKSVTRIYEGAFSGCTKLTSVTIPKSVTYIDDGVFSGCTNLTSISLPNSITSINERVFAGCTNLTSITIPNSVTSIGGAAFSGCSGLTSITIPNNVTAIGSQAFYRCTGLTSITIPNSVTSIGSNPFEFCANLTSINVESENAYYDSRNDCDAIIRKSDNTLVSGCEYTDIPNNVTSIGSAAFSGCQNLTSIIIPNSVTSIDWDAFSCCSNLTSITIPNSVTSIGENAFAASGITSIIIPNSVTSIGEYAFGACSSLKSVTINVNKYLRIEYDCFRCSPEKIILSGKTLPAYTNSYGEFPYNTATLYVPSSLYEDYKSSSPWGNFKKIERWVDSPASLSDGETYINTIPSDNAEVSYTRNFDNTSWQALYIPFSMSYDDWKEDFDVAHINSIHQYDKDDDGIIDETVMEVVKIKNGSLIPNTPYLIRAKTTGEKTITVTNSTLCKSEENSIECSTMLAKYTFTGTYKPIWAYTLITNKYYAMGGGSLIMTDGSSGLKPYRWYMKIEARSPMYNVSDGAKTITINVVGEDETTGITNTQHLSPNTPIYDLNGRRVNNNNLKPGIYVKNGKKIIIK